MTLLTALAAALRLHLVFLPKAARWVFAPLPSTWIAWALWATTLPGALATACASVALTAVVATPLTRRFLDRATRADAG